MPLGPEQSIRSWRQKEKTRSAILIILVNYRGTADTIECLQALRRLQGNFDIVVVDNSPEPELADHIRRTFIEGQPWLPPDNEPWKRIGGQPPAHSFDVGFVALDTAFESDGTTPPRLSILQAKSNEGFAAANNLGLRYGLAHGYRDFWLLNNDTIVAPDALQAIEATLASQPGYGLCGTTVALYHRPDKVQCFGGARYDRNRAGSMYIGYEQPLTPLPSRETVERELDMIVGASMIVSRDFLLQVGLMNEGYFLYFEEMDWSCRNGGRFPQIYAPEAIVYHKHGGTIGESSTRRKKTGPLALRYLHPNRLVFTARYFPRHLRRVRWAMLKDAVKLWLKGDRSAAMTVTTLALGKVPDAKSTIPNCA